MDAALQFLTSHRSLFNQNVSYYLYVNLNSKYHLLKNDSQVYLRLSLVRHQMYPLNGGDKVKRLDAHDFKCFSACLECYMSKMKLNIGSKILVHGRSHLGFIIATCRLRLLLREVINISLGVDY